MHRGIQIGLLCLFLYAGTAAACSCLCVGSNSLDNNDCGCCKYKISVVGYVLSVTPTGGFPGNLLVDVFISEEIRDKYGEITEGAVQQFTTQSSTAACGFPLTPGSTYILYIWDSSGFGISLCSASSQYSLSAYNKARSSCSTSGLIQCGLITNLANPVAVGPALTLTDLVLPPDNVLPISATVVSALPSLIDFEGPTEVSIIKFPKTKKPCPKGFFRAKCEAEITGQVPGFDYSNDQFVRVGYDCNGPWAILGDQNGDGLYDSCIVCPDGTEAMDLDGDGAEEVCTCPDPKEEICGQCPGLDYSIFLDPANTNGIVFCKPNDFDCGKNAILADLDCAVDSNGNPTYDVCQLCPDGTQAFDSNNDGCEDKCATCIPYKPLVATNVIADLIGPITGVNPTIPAIINASLINISPIVSPFIPPNKPCPPGWVPAPCEKAIFGLPFYIDYSEQLAGICPDKNLCGANAILGDSDLDGVIDVCIVCPSPLVAVDLDGDGCNDTCDCKKPIDVIVSPFLDNFAVAATLDDLTATPSDLTATPSAVPIAASSFKATPQIEKGVCNNCPNIPFYNSEFCSPGLDCGPAGILGDTDCDGVFDVCYECPDGTYPIDTNGDGCEDCCSECIPVTPIFGACCDKLGGCKQLSEEGCASVGGTFTIGASCSDITCKNNLGACCVSDGCIESTTPQNCKKQKGTFFQSKTCEEIDEICNPVSGACCVVNSVGFEDLNPPCFEGPSTQCPGLYYPSVTCEDLKDTCKRRGVCCYASGGCGIVFESQCDADSVFVPGALTCSPDVCPEEPTGACCSSAGCQATTEDGCFGQFFYGATCDEVNDICFPPPQMISCCLNGQCLFSAVDSADSRFECTAAGGTVLIGECDDVNCPTVSTVSCCLDSQCIYEGPFNPFVIDECEAQGGVYFEGDCSLNSACEDPNQNVFSCCLDGQCLGESPFLWVIEETCQDGTIFDGPCSQNDECNRGSCCLPDGGCIDDFLSNEFIIDCQAQGGFTSGGPCTSTCGSSFACCLPDGTCQGGILNADSSAACAANGGVLSADQSCSDIECPVDDNLISCCIDGRCEFEGPPNVGLEIECNAAGGLLLTGPCVENECPSISSCCLLDGTCFDGPDNSIQDQCPPSSGILQAGSCSEIECPVPPPPTGACCREDGICGQSPNGECDGQFFAGLSCSDIGDECPPVAACCFGTSCVDVLGTSSVQGLETECGFANGAFFPGQKCTPDLCLGACCIKDGSCLDVPSDKCIPENGAISFTPGASCDDASVNCKNDPEPSACCLSDGTCVSVFEAECVDADGNEGVFLPGQTCDQNDICKSTSPPPLEITCCRTDGSCGSVASPNQCQGQVFFGVSCDDAIATGACPAVIACCLPDGGCFDGFNGVAEECDFANGIISQGQTCAQIGECPTSSPPPLEIVCCGFDGTCGPVTDTTQCQGQVFTGTTCADLAVTGACPAISACCLPDGGCFDGGNGIAVECNFANGILTVGSTCDDVSCGTCCDLNGVCSTSTLQECQAERGCYSSLSDTCTNPACDEKCEVIPCSGNVDGDQQVSVSDLVVVVEIVVGGSENSCSFSSLPPPFNQQSCCGPKLGCVLAAGDVSNDGEVNIQDVTQLVGCIVGSGAGCEPCLR